MDKDDGSIISGILQKGASRRGFLGGIAKVGAGVLAFSVPSLRFAGPAYAVDCPAPIFGVCDLHHSTAIGYGARCDWQCYGECDCGYQKAVLWWLPTIQGGCNAQCDYEPC